MIGHISLRNLSESLFMAIIACPDNHLDVSSSAHRPTPRAFNFRDLHEPTVGSKKEMRVSRIFMNNNIIYTTYDVPPFLRSYYYYYSTMCTL